MKSLIAYGRKLGVNYLWGIINFTVGVALGGIWVALSLIAHGVL
jgi:hypothetical protein